MEKGIGCEKSKLLYLSCTPIATQMELHDLSNAWSRPRKWTFQILAISTGSILYESSVRSRSISLMF